MERSRKLVKRANSACSPARCSARLARGGEWSLSLARSFGCSFARYRLREIQVLPRYKEQLEAKIKIAVGKHAARRCELRRARGVACSLRFVACFSVVLDYFDCCSILRSCMYRCKGSLGNNYKSITRDRLQNCSPWISCLNLDSS